MSEANAKASHNFSTKNIDIFEISTFEILTSRKLTMSLVLNNWALVNDRNTGTLFDCARCIFIISQWQSKHCDLNRILTSAFVVVVALLFYVHGKHLRSCRDGQLT